MVKKCLGSILLPEKHSLLYLSMFLRQELFTLNKNRRMGEGENLEFSCMPETCWLKFSTSRVQTRLATAALWKSHVEGFLAFGAQHKQSSFASWIKKVIPQIIKCLFCKTNKLLPTLPRKHLTTLQPQVPRQSTGVRAIGFHSDSPLTGVTGRERWLQDETEL